MRRKDSRLLWMSVILCLFLSISVYSEGVYEDWVAQYDGPVHGEDKPYALAVDDKGFLYVTGSTWNGNTFDYVTIKYAPNGDTEWLRVYEGPDDGHDVATDIVVDSKGNPIVTGYSWGNSTLYDYLTIKYDNMGNKLWEERYNGPAGTWDQGTALALDNLNNIYVTGQTVTEYDRPPDYGTIKYTSKGELVWVKFFNGSSEGNDVDLPRVMTVDPTGNVFVSGATNYSFGSVNVGYGTIKYNSKGDQEWVRYHYGEARHGYNSPSALALDRNGNLFVTGGSVVYDNQHGVMTAAYVTIKYSSNGTVLWEKYYKGILSTPDYRFPSASMAIAVDSLGFSYVTGWSNSYNARDIFTIKYSPTGDTIWTRRYDNPKNLDDTPAALIFDEDGNIIVTGWSRNASSTIDYKTIKYDNDGNLIWETQYNSPANADDRAIGLVLNSVGDVYVCGMTSGSNTSLDFTTIRYSDCPGFTGEINGDDRVNVVDLVYLVNVVFKSWQLPRAQCMGDITGDGVIQLGDVIYLPNYVFKFGPAPIASSPCCQLPSEP